MKRLPGSLPPPLGSTLSIHAKRLAWRRWIDSQIVCWTSLTFVTLNFRPSLRSDAGRTVHLDEQTTRSEVKKFGARVDRTVYGNRVRRFNRRVRRIPVLEHGQERGWHCHLAMEKPLGMADVQFVKVLRDAWSVSAWSVGSPDIGPAEPTLAGYLTKYRSKSAMEDWSDSIIVEAVVVHTK